MKGRLFLTTNSDETDIGEVILDVSDKSINLRLDLFPILMPNSRINLRFNEKIPEVILRMSKVNLVIKGASEKMGIAFIFPFNITLYPIIFPFSKEVIINIVEH